MAMSKNTKRGAAAAALLLLLFGVAAAYQEEEEEEGEPDDDEDEEPTTVVIDPEAIPEDWFPDDDEQPDGGGGEPEPEGEEPIDVVIIDPEDWWPDDDGDEWHPERWEHPDNYPTAGLFYRVEDGARFFGQGSRKNIAWAALYEAAYQAAIEEGGVSDAEARTFASSIAGNSKKRSAYTTLILCSPWNDALYGTYGFGKGAWEGPHGRSIRLMPYHASNRQRIRDRLPPIRNIQMRTPADKKKGNARAISAEHRNTWEFLWLPPLNLKRLWEQGTIGTQGLEWEDGSNMLWPPPMIANLGIETMEPVGDREFGCLGVTGTFG